MATCGTSLTVDHIKILRRYTANIQLLFDGDGAGFTATIRAVKLCLEQDIYPQVLVLPKPHKDADDLANDDSLTDIEKRDCLTSKLDAITHIYMSLKNKHNISNPVEKKTLLNEMFDIMSYIPDMTIRTDYINMIADDMSTNAAYLIANYQTRVSKNRSTFAKKEEIIKPQIDKNLLIRAIRD